ncbi:hypothetical protein IWQ60_005354 [Tieghemiomyces parasiticus]|uniref:Uncharacterized protein n=1 Tax=Tieghemiomyces parasiticus TaxID=78921 RepID=A0A9W8DYJ0_9FUNG|nr:hypothetical protein IWQ60_005354 [Tieghemiomyces parasiticus]
MPGSRDPTASPDALLLSLKSALTTLDDPAKGPEPMRDRGLDGPSNLPSRASSQLPRSARPASPRPPVPAPPGSEGEGDDDDDLLPARAPKASGLLDLAQFLRDTEPPLVPAALSTSPLAKAKRPNVFSNLRGLTNRLHFARAPLRGPVERTTTPPPRSTTPPLLPSVKPTTPVPIPAPATATVTGSPPIRHPSPSSPFYSQPTTSSAIAVTTSTPTRHRTSRSFSHAQQLADLSASQPQLPTLLVAAEAPTAERSRSSDTVQTLSPPDCVVTRTAVAATAGSPALGRSRTWKLTQPLREPAEGTTRSLGRPPRTGSRPVAGEKRVLVRNFAKYDPRLNRAHPPPPPSAGLDTLLPSLHPSRSQPDQPRSPDLHGAEIFAPLNEPPAAVAPGLTIPPRRSSAGRTSSSQSLAEDGQTVNRNSTPSLEALLQRVGGNLTPTEPVDLGAVIAASQRRIAQYRRAWVELVAEESPLLAWSRAQGPSITTAGGGDGSPLLSPRSRVLIDTIMAQPDSDPSSPESLEEPVAPTGRNRSSSARPPSPHRPRKRPGLSPVTNAADGSARKGSPTEARALLAAAGPLTVDAAGRSVTSVPDLTRSLATSPVPPLPLVRRGVSAGTES